jgi:preprotein translocase subunit SecE
MTQRIYSVAKSEEKDSVEPTSSGASSTPDEVEISALEQDEAVLEPTAADTNRSDVLEEPELVGPVERVHRDRFEPGAEAGDGPVGDEASSAGAALDARELDRREADESDGELVAVGAPAERSTVKSRGSSRVEKKGRATPKQRPSARTGGRTSPVTFVKESVGELRKVVYPTGQQLANYFVVVLIFVLFIIAIVSLLDLAFGWAILKVFS